MKRHCFTLDLYDDPELIRGYDQWHQQVWPEIIDSIRASGIVAMQIYRISNRLFMIMDVNDQFNFELKASMDLDNEKVQQWETLMWQFQKGLPFAKPGEKWVLMNEIFSLK
ncbi:MAG: L-rhamnose mutarotase [Bacteroidota bacterium]